MKTLDLDVSSPDKVPTVLMAAADRFSSDADNLSSSWQDKQAGKPWQIISLELAHAAYKIESKLRRLGYL